MFTYLFFWEKKVILLKGRVRALIIFILHFLKNRGLTATTNVATPISLYGRLFIALAALPITPSLKLYLSVSRSLPSCHRSY